MLGIKINGVCANSLMFSSKSINPSSDEKPHSQVQKELREQVNSA